MFCRCLTTSAAALLLAATCAVTGPRAQAAPPGNAAQNPAPQRMPLLKAMSGDIVAEVPVTITLPADYESSYDREHSTNGTFWATRDDLRAAVQGDGVDTTKLTRGLFWFRHALNAGYDAQKGKFIPEESAEELAKKTGVTNLKIADKTVNGRAIRTITCNSGDRRVYLLYVWTGIDTNCILVSYHHPAGKHSPRDDQVWSQFVDGLGQATSKVHETPEQAFRAFMAAGEKEDWKGMCECLTNETRDKLAAGLIFAGSLAKGFATTEEQKAKLKAVDDVLAKYGIKDGQAPANAPKTEMDLEKAMMKLIESIQDRNAFIADVLAAFKQASDHPSMNPLAAPFFGFKDVRLEEVKIRGNSATAVAVARRDGQEARQPLNFRKVGDGWRIEIPESDNRGNGVQSGTADKSMNQPCLKCGGCVKQMEERPI